MPAEMLERLDACIENDYSVNSRSDAVRQAIDAELPLESVELDDAGDDADGESTTPPP